ncbi:outer membrane beta-barrel family protein [Pedobacter sp. NJ-S-72]
MIGNLLTTKTNDLNNTLSILQSNNNGFPKQHNYSGGINYDAQFKTREFHILTAIAQIDNRQTEDIQNTNQLSNVLVNYWKTKSRNNIVIRSAQADYIQDLNSGKLELGGKYAYTSTANNLRYDTLGNESFNLDPKRSNLFNYQEYIAAGYLSYLKFSGKFSYSLSLRAEHTRTLANSITEGTLTERSYLKWLPSASLTYEVAKDQQVSFSYSRRLTRPTFNALNPFRFYFSPRNYWIGNPYLQPSTTNLFSLSYSKKALNISINAGRENDPMVRYPEYDPVTNILAYMGTNSLYRGFANIVASSPITINEWWRMNNSLGLYYNRELMPYLGQTYKIPVFNYILNGSQVFTLRKWLVDLSYYYQSRGGNSLYIIAPVYTFDLGLQRSWLNSRLSSKLSVQDVFNKGRQRLIFREKKIIDNDFYHDNGTRRLVFSLTYNFGRSTYKAKEDKKSEEENRVNR